MANSKEKWVDDVAFIFEECERVSRQTIDNPTKLTKEDAGYSIPHPISGEMLCGLEAERRLLRLAEEAGRRYLLLQKVEIYSLRSIISQLIVQRFLKEKRELTSQEMDKIFRLTSKQTQKICKDITHFIPCHLIYTKQPEEIAVGPVLFRNKQQFRNLLAPKSRVYRQCNNPAERTTRRNLLREALRYYKMFNWVAEVTVEGCEPTVSQKIAEQTVISALDGLHLILGSNWTDRMRVGGPGIRRDVRAKFELSDNGVLDVSTSSSLLGQVNFSESWSENLHDPYITRILELYGIALQSSIKPNVNRPFSERVIDAAQWFGEASREDNPATKLIKFTTSIERIAMTEEHKDIARYASDRVATFCLDTLTKESFTKTQNKMRRVYAIRSKLLHGSMSPRSRSVISNLHDSSYLARKMILAVLDFFGAQFLQYPAISSRRLGKEFNKIVEFRKSQLNIPPTHQTDELVG